MKDTLVFEGVYPCAGKEVRVTMVFGIQNQARLNHGPFSSNHLIRSWGKGKRIIQSFLPEYLCAWECRNKTRRKKKDTADYSAVSYKLG
jgi:hypothetical protein